MARDTDELVLNCVLQWLVPNYLARKNVASSPGYVRWHTYALNRVFERASRGRSFWRVWFNLGLVVGLLAMLGGVLLLVYSLLSALAAPTEPSVLTPIVWNREKQRGDAVI